jgi:hypothetical protein
MSDRNVQDLEQFLEAHGIDLTRERIVHELEQDLNDLGWEVIEEGHGRDRYVLYVGEIGVPEHRFSIASDDATPRLAFMRAIETILQTRHVPSDV